MKLTILSTAAVLMLTGSAAFGADQSAKDAVVLASQMSQAVAATDANSGSCGEQPKKCASLDMQINFVGTGVSIDDNSLSTGSGHISTMVSQAAQSGAAQFTNTTMPNGSPRIISDVALSLNVTKSENPNQTNISGSFLISPARQQLLTQKYGNACPTNISFQSGIADHTLYSGILSLEFNGQVEQLRM